MPGMLCYSDVAITSVSDQRVRCVVLDSTGKNPPLAGGFVSAADMQAMTEGDELVCLPPTLCIATLTVISSEPLLSFTAFLNFPFFKAAKKHKVAEPHDLRFADDELPLLIAPPYVKPTAAGRGRPRLPSAVESGSNEANSEELTVDVPAEDLLSRIPRLPRLGHHATPNGYMRNIIELRQMRFLDGEHDASLAAAHTQWQVCIRAPFEPAFDEKLW